MGQKMKKFAAFMVALALFPAISFAAQTTGRSATNTATPAQTVGGRIYVVAGKVEVKQGSHAAHQVTDSEDFVPDTMVNTGEHSSALLKFTDGQIVTLQPNSSFHVVEYRYDPKQIKKSGMVLSMFQGGMRFVTGLIGQQRKQGFRLLTPHATIGIRGTEFMVAMADNSMYSQVLTGNIGVTNAAGTLTLGAGQTAAVTSSNALATLGLWLGYPRRSVH